MVTASSKQNANDDIQQFLCL